MEDNFRSMAIRKGMKFEHASFGLEELTATLKP
jgi:hypothetical protein